MKPQPSPELGHRIRVARAVRGLSEAEFAAKMGVSVLRVRKWERGSQSPSRATRDAIAAALAVGLGWMETGILPADRPDWAAQVAALI